MGKLMLNGVEYTGGGDYSESVSVTQIQSTGTKIATISVNDVDTDLYAPSGGSSTDTKVTQIPTDDTVADYELLFSKTADNTEHTEEVRKTQFLKYNPSTRNLSIKGHYYPNPKGASLSVRYTHEYGENYIGVTAQPAYTMLHLTNHHPVLPDSPIISLTRTYTEQRSTLDQIYITTTDIDLSGTNNTWDGTNTSLKSAIAACSGTRNLRGLSDVTISSVTNGQVLKYDYSTSKWVNGKDSLSNLSDITITTPTDKQTLMYDNATSKWVNGTTNLGDLGNVVITTPANNQVLKYNSTTSRWENANESGGGGGSYTEVTGTLLAGNTTVTITDSAITPTATYDFYTDVYGINPTNVNILTGSITLTFEEQSSDVLVKVRVS